MTNRPLISGPLGLGDLLDRAFRLYRARFGSFLLTAAIFLIPFSLISGLLTGQFITGYVDAISAITVSPGEVPDSIFGELFGAVGSFFGVMFVLGFAGLLINAVVALALTSQSIAVLHEEPLTLSDGVRRGLRRFWSYVWMNIVQYVLIFLATLAVLIPLFILVFAVIFAGAAFGSVALDDNIIGAIAAVLVIVCGYIFALVIAFVPTIYLSARWIVATPVLLAENLGAMDALRRSWQLTQKQKWRVVGYLILLGLITFVVISLPIGLLQQILLVALPTAAGLGLSTAISTALSSVFTVVWTPFYICAVVLLYYDLRVRAEGYDLDLRVQQLESQVQVRDEDE
jgi:hypothetical protein